MSTAAAQPEFPRTFVAADVRFDSWGRAEPYYRDLLDRQIQSHADLERWLRDWSELDAAFAEEETVRYTAMTCQTDDAQREQAFLEFIEHIKPQREPLLHRLREKLVASAKQHSLPEKRYEVLLRSAANSVALFRDENISLQTEDSKLQQRYQKIVGGLTVNWDGAEVTLPRLMKLLEEPDRDIREQAWRAASDRFLTESENLDRLYDDMVRLRHRMAINAGMPNYRDYMFRRYERFDYTAEDCFAFHDAIAKVVVPAASRLAGQRRRKLELPSLRPWDTAVDVDNRPPLRPFETESELVGGCQRIFTHVHPELGQIFSQLRERDTLDLSSRKGKAPGGYQASLEERRLPFIFMNAVGTESDVRTLLHEGGHAFHSWAARQEPLLPYRSAPIEFCEVASMGMELLALPHLEEFYGIETNRARRRFLEGIVQFFPWMARVDAFQHYVYTNLDHDPQRRNDEWVALAERFGPEIDWSGLEPHLRSSWHRKLHFFEVPFYYVEYGIAQLGALQVWLNSRKDYDQAVALYRNGLALGGMRPLPELFAAAGLRFDFSEQTLRPLIDAVMEEIDALAD